MRRIAVQTQVRSLLEPRNVLISLACLVESESMEVIEEEGAGPPAESAEPQVFLPGTTLQEGEELVRDSSTYHMYHVVSL